MQWRWRYHRGKSGVEYAVRYETFVVNGRRKTVAILMHTVVVGYPRPDYIDGNGLNNQENNLRLATRSQNLMNQHKQSGTSRFKGVFWCKREGKWGVQIYKDGRKYFLGYFSDETEAARAYDRKAIELFGEFACLNFPI